MIGLVDGFLCAGKNNAFHFQLFAIFVNGM